MKNPAALCALILASISLFVASARCLIFVFTEKIEKQNLQKVQWVWLLLALVFLTTALAFYSRASNSCPIRGIDEILAFISWSMCLWFFILGKKYRNSSIGLLSAPLIATLTLLAVISNIFLQPSATIAEISNSDSFWRGLHASLALLGYGAFSLAAMAGGVFCLQDKALRSGNPSLWAFRLPALNYLNQAIKSLLLLGFTLTSISILLAFQLSYLPSTIKLVTIGFVWLVYGVLLLLISNGKIPTSRIAYLAMVLFAVPVASLWTLSDRTPEKLLHEESQSTNPE